MARTFEPPEPFARRGWRIKIRDRERVEPPHATLLFKTRAWRYDLRDGRFLDRDPDPKELPPALVKYLGRILPELIEAWDSLYPGNKVDSEEARGD